MSVMGYGFVMGIRFDMTELGRRRSRGGTGGPEKEPPPGNLKSQACPGPMGVMASGGLSAEPLEVGWGLPLVRGPAGRT